MNAAVIGAPLGPGRAPRGGGTKPGGGVGGGGGRDPFMPRPPAGRWSALALAVVAHVLLILALAFGVDWHDDAPTTVAAELWSATPQAAAPRAVEPTPMPQPLRAPASPSPAPRPVERPPDAVKAAPNPAPTLPDPQIAIEQARREQVRRDQAAAEQAARVKRDQAAREAQAEQAQQRRQQELAAAQARDRQAAQAKAARDAEQRKLDQARAQQERAEKAEKTARAAEAQQASQARVTAERAEAARTAALREAQLKRILGQAGATGGPTDSGAATRSSGPSANYAGRVAARVKPNIVFSDAVDGNPTAVVQVRLGADGTITAKRLIQSSGFKAWDEAVLRAVERTEQLPLDNGRAPPQFEIGFRPKD